MLDQTCAPRAFATEAAARLPVYVHPMERVPTLVRFFELRTRANFLMSMTTDTGCIDTATVRSGLTAARAYGSHPVDGLLLVLLTDDFETLVEGADVGHVVLDLERELAQRRDRHADVVAAQLCARGAFHHHSIPTYQAAAAPSHTSFILSTTPCSDFRSGMEHCTCTSTRRLTVAERADVYLGPRHFRLFAVLQAGGRRCVRCAARTVEGLDGAGGRACLPVAGPNEHDRHMLADGHAARRDVEVKVDRRARRPAACATVRTGGQLCPLRAARIRTARASC